MNFDKAIDRRGTNCAKWDKMEALYGVSNKTGISMWVADMDFHPRTVFRTRCNLMQTMGSMAITVTIRLTATQFAGGRKTGMVGPLTQVGFFQLTGWSTGPRFA